MSSVPVIDVHTHMLSEAWLNDIRAHGAPKYGVKPTAAGADAAISVIGLHLVEPAVADYLGAVSPPCRSEAAC